MTLEEKVLAVEAVFERLGEEISAFQKWSGLRCPAGCGKCCFKPDIEATVLEFLPFALHLYKNSVAGIWLTKVKEQPSSVCLILNPLQAGQGLCSEYRYRGLICRLFGYSARTNKYGRAELITCQVIKDQHAYPHAAGQLETGAREVPLMNRYYMQLHAIDIDLTRDFYPINQAIRKAIETVLHYYAYRNES